MNDATPVPDAPTHPLTRAARRVLPFVVSAAILYYYLRDLDWAAMAEIAGRVNLPLAVVAVAVPQILNWYLGTLVIARTIQWFHGPFSMRDFFWVRGAAYILGFVNSALGGGGQLLYQQRRAGISWTALMGIVLFRVGLILWGACLVMIPVTLAMHLTGVASRVSLNLHVWWAVLIFGALWLAEAWHNWHHGGYWGLSRVVARDRDHEFWTAFRRSTPRHWLLFWAYTLPQLGSTVVGCYLLNRAFGIDAPLLESLVVIPLALVIMDLPIAFAGFGTATIGWMAFFGEHGSAADITALTLFLPAARMLTRAAIGLLSLRPALGEIGFLLRALESRPRRGTA